MNVAVRQRPAQIGKTKWASRIKRKKFRAVMPRFNAAIPGDKRLTKPKIADVREELGWSRKQLAFVMNASERAVVNWDAGDPISPVYAAKLREIQSLIKEIRQVMKPKEIGHWLVTEMEEFEGRSPAELVSKGETVRVWASLFYLRSGMPD